MAADLVRMRRTAATSWPAGRQVPVEVALAGEEGQASPQPMVMTTSETSTASVVSTFGVW